MIEDLTAVWLAVFMLATHGLTHLVRVAEITEGIRDALGAEEAGTNFISRVLRCPFCTGVWAGPIVGLLCLIWGGPEVRPAGLVAALPIFAFVGGVTAYTLDMFTLMLEETLSDLERRRGGPDG